MTKKTKRGIFERLGNFLASFKAHNVQTGTDETIKSTGLLLDKAGRLKNVDFEQAKGNLFEYIEAAKLQTNLANETGAVFDRTPLTDIDEPHAPDDFRFSQDGRITGRGQAKFNNSPHKSAVNFTNPKYSGMQRIAPSDKVPLIRDELEKMLRNGEISRVVYDDAVKSLYDGLTDPRTGISSGGTSSQEIYSLCGEDGKISTKAMKKYVRKFRYRQYGRELSTTTGYGAAYGAAAGGIVSGVRNIFAAFNDEKELDQAVKDTVIDAAKSGLRGGSVGALSAGIRIAGSANHIPVISDATASTALAGGLIEGGAAVYSYIKGEINESQLQDELTDTTIKSMASVFAMKGFEIALKSVNPCLPVVVYMAASQVVMSAREIINNAKLNAEQHNRAAELLKESVSLMEDYRQKMNEYLTACEKRQRENFYAFLNGFSFDALTGIGYEETVSTIKNFADEKGMTLQHTSLKDYKRALMSGGKFILK